ncbi:hypothetical protein [Yoonia sp.]|uniref:hypothetical protein n=1 Tax=Yoonia sp. TaxID=2212373 RepID=UPI002E0BBDC7|nr:hypothetical protein [Yoonia sp.]
MNARATFPELDDIDETFVPQTEAELHLALKSWRWRIFSGKLYKIMTKADDDVDDAGAVMPFIPNSAQAQFIENMHYRNIILKARQLGFTTVIAILWLDHALFVADQRVGIIAHTLDDATVIFRDKVRFAYHNLPDAIRAKFPIKSETASTLHFDHNNSAIRVATSMRSGTIHRLHVSELGKLGAKFPEKAKEIVTGSLPAVPKTGIAIIESTAEGRSGEFYNMATRAEAIAQSKGGEKLAKSEWKFHFFPWWRDPGYTANPDVVPVAPVDHQYFDEIEANAGCKITLPQRAWYVSKRENDFAGDGEKMWQEMPSTSDECWQKSTEGTFLAPQLARARIEGRITRIQPVTQSLVHTFWDIGAGDGTGIWLMQQVGTQHRFLRYIEGWGEGYAHYVNIMRETGWVFGVHHLPHDADQTRQMAHKVGAPVEMLRELAPDWTFTIVPRVQTIQHGIDLMRGKFQEAWFDEEGCREGLEHLSLYRKKWNARLGVWSHEPEKLEGHSEAADALRQWAQGYDPSIISGPTRPRRRNRPAGGMWV